ncbi:putative uncharacterized protein [Prevotella sp. CAG:1058]|nr:putative uncharacterized protein [Prevotella sp. CAG:1058]
MGTIITTATIMAFYLNSASNIESPYYYNADIDNGQVKTMYVFDRQGESLIGKAEYRYEYDAEGRVTVKEVYSRSAATGRMMPRSRYEYTYTDDGYSLAHRMWNPDKQAFGKADSRTDYRMATEGVMAVTNYELQEGSSVMTPVSNILAIVPCDRASLAGF